MRRNLRIERIWNALIVSLSLEINHCRSQEVETGKEELVWMICPKRSRAVRWNLFG